MRKSGKRLEFTFLLAVTLWSASMLTAQSQEEAGAKSLFYDPATGVALKPAEKQKQAQHGRVRVKTALGSQVKYVGLHYWIDLEGIGSVTDDRVFHTGERIKLHLRSNVDGYLSLWSLDSSGRGQLLFPASGSADSENFVKADSEYVTPGFIKFSLPVEDERLLVFFSRSKADLPSLNKDSVDEGAITKTLGPAGMKALVFETEKKNPAEVGTYVVNRQGGPIAKEIRLRHQPPQGRSSSGTRPNK